MKLYKRLKDNSIVQNKVQMYWLAFNKYPSDEELLDVFRLWVEKSVYRNVLQDRLEKMLRSFHISMEDVDSFIKLRKEVEEIEAIVKEYEK